MGIEIYRLMNKNPDKIRSHKSNGRRYIWNFRNKEQGGFNVKITIISDDKLDQDKWKAEICEVEWNGNEFIEKNGSVSSFVNDNPQDLIKHVEKRLKEIFKNSESDLYPSIN